MTFADYLALLRRSWLLIVLTTVGGVGLGVAATALTTPVYSATAQTFVAIRNADAGDLGSAFAGAYFVQQRVGSYVELVGSPGVTEPVIEELGLDMTPAQLAGKVSADSPADTVLINITATDTDPQLAADIANATAQSFGREIQALETTTTGDVPVKISVTEPAGVPGSPDSPNGTLNVALGLLLGLGIGVSIALLRHTLDTTVKTGEDLPDAPGAAVLGSIGYDPSAKTQPLIAPDHGSPRGEGIRRLRTNLQFVDVDNPPRTIVVTSSVPSEGKTTTACNLAILLAQAGSRVLLVEADLRRPRIADYMGIAGGVGLTDVLIDKTTLAEVIVPWRRGLLDVLPSGSIPPTPSELLNSQQMRDLLTSCAQTYDYIILDAPPLLPVTDAAVLAHNADGALLVARHGFVRREQVAHAAGALEQAGGRLLGYVLNFVPARSQVGYGYGYEYNPSPNRRRQHLALGDVDPRLAEDAPDEGSPVRAGAAHRDEASTQAEPRVGG